MSNRQDLIRELYVYRYYIIFATAATYYIRRLYRQIYTIPKNLNHIPAISYGDLLKSLGNNEPLLQRTKRLVFPILSKANGIYLIRRSNNKFPFDWTVYVANPVLARHILYKPGNNKKKSSIMNPAFHHAQPINIFTSLMPQAFALIDESENKTISATQLSKRLTLDAIGKFAFDFNFKALEDKNSVWVKTYEMAFKGFMDIIPIAYPRLDWIYRKISKERRERYNAAFELMGLLDEIADGRLKWLLKNKSTISNRPKSEKDLLTLMLEGELAGEGIWTKLELRHNMALLFLAGHDTTSHSLAHCLYELAVNPDIQEKARQESINVLGSELVDVFPTLQDSKNFPYLDMIIKEVLRMHAPFNEVSVRVSHEDVELGGIVIPKNTIVNIDIEALHYNPDTWKNPEQFDPERFAEGGEHYSHEGVTWVPFSGGSRQCIGINFSMMEQRIALSMLLRKYTWKLPEGSKHENGIVADLPLNFAPESLEIQFIERY
ncbi:hypothetical protein INT45_012033 [Circinella minor]|uniref:Cytochrome P450 n=1 Tax=Circinella minor TaxID=1195481 RepID=A0A8H7VUX3_9FUNG|nr:hypothetical protein INT45_012033 [Circinella minor]